MKKLLITVALISMIFPLSRITFAAQEHPWQLKIQKDGIQVYTRKVDGSAMLEFKSDIVVSVPLNKAIDFFEDEKSITKWYYQCQRMDLVQDEGPLEKILYIVLRLPWPVAERDCVFRQIKSLDASTGAVTYEFTALPDRLPLQKGKVRVPYLKTVWRFMPLQDNQTKIYFQQHCDAGGFVPAFMANALVTDTPLNSLKKFRELVQKT